MAGNNDKKPTLLQTLVLEVMLALMVQWKSIVECYTQSNSLGDFITKIGTIFFVTIGIVKPGTVLSKFIMKGVSRMWEMLAGHPLNAQTNAEMERWFQVVTSFVAQYGFAALLQWSKYTLLCLQNNKCEGPFLFCVCVKYLMDLRSMVCGQSIYDAPKCYNIFNHLPIAVFIITCVVISMFSIIYIYLEGRESVEDIQVVQVQEAQVATVERAPAEQKLKAFCPNCQNHTEFSVPLVLRNIYCKNC